MSEKVDAAMKNLKETATEGTSGRGSPVVETLASAGTLAGIEYESGGEGGDGKPVPEFGGVPKDDKEEETREKHGGVMHWLGLAGGRKRRRKKSRKSKKKSKSRRGGDSRKSKRKSRRKSKRKKSRRRRKKSRRRRR